MKKSKIISLIITAMILCGISGLVYIFQDDGESGGFIGISISGDQTELKKFNSYEEIEEFFDRTEENQGSGLYYDVDGDGVFSSAPSYKASGVSDGGAAEHSNTNIQVEGVDEGDIVKNDGKYAYVVSSDGSEVIIVDVYPPQDAEIISRIGVIGSISEIYLSQGKLVLVGTDYSYSSNYNPFINLYNIDAQDNPSLLQSIRLSGNYVSSRLIGDYFYAIASQRSYNIESEDDLPVPANEIYYTDTYDSSYTFTTITASNINDNDELPINHTVLIGSSSLIYVSLTNIYITHRISNFNQYSSFSMIRDEEGSNEETAIHRISISGSDIQYESSGLVTGRILNRYSMSEHNNFFRVATTTGHVSRSDEGTALNQVHVLDLQMDLIGQINNIAPGERIYSARFMGDRAYLVTFDKVDPFFVIDLKNPVAPKILGELKIPGYSDYLHPYDENHIIGLGKDTVLAEEGTFSWYQGVKLSLFDVRDVTNPKEVSKFIIGDRGTYSTAQRDPHAFLFSRDKNLLVLPIQLYEIDEDDYPEGASANTRGEFKMNCAYVIDITLEKGFMVKGTICHPNAEVEEDYYWNYNNNNAIKRSFYIEDNLYTVSNENIKVNSLIDLDEINLINLEN
jgi:uncharacterized secreted protein with C-terminal beta-propeller domain